MSDVLHSSIQQVKMNQISWNDEEKEEEEEKENLDTNKKGVKRKLDPEESTEENQENPTEFGKLNKAKNVSKLILPKMIFHS